VAAADSALFVERGVWVGALVPYPHLPASATAAAAAIASRAVQQHIAVPVAAALGEWRRTLALPDGVLWERPAARPPARRPRRHGDLHLAVRGVADRGADLWALATAPWRTAAALHAELVLRRIWLLRRHAPAVLRAQAHESGTPLGDLRLLTDSPTDGRDRLAALERTVDRIQWRPRNAAVRRELAASAGSPGGIVGAKRRELRAAVYLVLAERGRPQAHRFGRAWLTSHDGHPAAAVPEQLDDGLYWRWFCDEVRKAAEASLLGEPYPAGEGAPPDQSGTGPPAAVDGRAPGRDGSIRRLPRIRIARLSDTHLESLEDPSPGPAELLIAQERRRESLEAWLAALAAASPRQRDLLRVLAGGAGDGPVGAEHDASASVESLTEAALRLGIAPSTARVQWKRLVDRLHANHLLQADQAGQAEHPQRDRGRPKA
jgi:hypothetical protein